MELLRARRIADALIRQIRPFTHRAEIAGSIRTIGAAVAALNRWEPEEEKEPSGWIRHPRTGRRREGGNPELEVVRQ